MRLKWLTNFNTLLLVTVCIALGATLWWSQRALERPYQLMERYLGLSQQFQNQAARNIQAYLGSGDALRHAAAMEANQQLQAALAEWPGELADKLRPSLDNLQAFTGCHCSTPPCTSVACRWPGTSWSAAAARSWPTKWSASCN